MALSGANFTRMIFALFFRITSMELTRKRCGRVPIPFQKNAVSRIPIYPRTQTIHI